MQLINYPIKAPGMCFLCESTPSNGVIDIFRDFDTHVPTKLTGRKYVCKDCVMAMADVLGWVHPDRLWQLEELLENTNHELTHYRDENKKLQEMLNEDYKALLQEALKPTIRKTTKKQEVK